MELKKVEQNGVICAVVESGQVVITDPQSALDGLPFSFALDR